MAEGFKDIMNKLEEIKNDMNKQIQSLDLKVSNFQEQLDVFVNKIESLEAENKELNNEFKISKAFLWGLRRENKANNLILYNVPNINDSTSQELETKIMIFLQKDLKANVSLQDIDQIRKIGRKEAQRPVLVRFVAYRKKMEVLKLSGNLKGTKISISQDYLYEVRQVRKQLLPYLYKARKRRQWNPYR
uniref:Endonuclease-reverse transcriptase n=1 Tax=Rhodnius prolixus TaxID=13249 RepID=T1I8Y1_RHOPR